MAEEKPIRILLINEHAIVRAGYRMLIEAQSKMHKVVAEAARGDEALNLATGQAFDIILLDLDLEVNNYASALDVIPALVSSCSGARILILTGSKSPEISRQVARLGAMGLLSKNDSAQTLCKAIEKIHSGEPWFDRVTLGSLLSGTSTNAAEGPENTRIATLTAREREVIALIAEGLKNKQ